MSAAAIKRIPNVEHTRRVLESRRALRLVPPSEGVWPASVAGGRSPETTQLARPEGRQNGDAEGSATPKPYPNKDN